MTKERKGTPVKASVVPIAQRLKTPSLPQVGRIRMGKKTEKGTERVNHWILTSSRRDQLEILAAEYGGKVKEWTDTTSKDKFRLQTGTDELEVILHPEGIQEPLFELWDGGGCRRRCDAITCTWFPKDGSQPVEGACPCNKSGDVLCKPKTHLRVMFPQTVLGFWRLVTSSNTAIPELFGSAEVIREASNRGYPNAVLRIEHRSSGFKQWTVPVLTSTATMGQLLTGMESKQLESGTPPKSQPPELRIVTDDNWDDIEDAEIVGDDE